MLPHNSEMPGEPKIYFVGLPLLYEGGQITWPQRLLHYLHFIFENLIQFHFTDIAVQGEILPLMAKNEVVPHS